MTLFGGMMLLGNSTAFDADQCLGSAEPQYFNARKTISIGVQTSGGAVTTGVPRRFNKIDASNGSPGG